MSYNWNGVWPIATVTRPYEDWGGLNNTSLRFHDKRNRPISYPPCNKGKGKVFPVLN